MLIQIIDNNQAYIIFQSNTLLYKQLYDLYIFIILLLINSRLFYAYELNIV